MADRVLLIVALWPRSRFARQSRGAFIDGLVEKTDDLLVCRLSCLGNPHDHLKVEVGRWTFTFSPPIASSTVKCFRGVAHTGCF